MIANNGRMNSMFGRLVPLRNAGVGVGDKSGVEAKDLWCVCIYTV